MVKKIFAVTFYTGKEKDISKRWFLRIKVPDYVKGCFTYKKCYGDINKFHTAAERLAEMERLKKHIEATGDYIIAQGSRNIGYVAENTFTDTIYQLQQCLTDRKPTVRQSTYRKYAGILKNVSRWLVENNNPNLPAGAFSALHARAFLTWVMDHMSNQSYNAHLQLLKCLFEDLVHKKVITENPFSRIKAVTAMNVPPLPFSVQQVALLSEKISVQDPQLWLFIQFVYYCFIRPGELRLLKVANINFDENKIQVLAPISKNNKTQWVSIPRPLRAAIAAAGIAGYDRDYYIFSRHGKPGVKPLGKNNMKNRHRPFLKELKFDAGHVLYSWKHTGASACAKAGMPLKDLQLQLRHHSLDQVNAYLQSMLVEESDFINNKFPVI